LCDNSFKKHQEGLNFREGKFFDCKQQSGLGRAVFIVPLGAEKYKKKHLQLGI